MKNFNTLFLILILFFNFSNAQELPPIEKFTSEDYRAGNQNWMISQASNKFMYVGNNDGLLEYNGAEWHLYTSPNNTNIRAVKVIGDRIYTGCYMEFGYWKKDTYGNLKYSSLLPQLKVKMLEDEHIWNIIKYENWILFQSFNRIYFYNTDDHKFTFISSSKTISKLIAVNGIIYYHVLNEGIYEIKEGSSKLMLYDKIIKDDRIVNIFSIDQGLLIQTRRTGFYTYINHTLSEWKIAAKQTLKEVNVLSSVQLKDKSFVLGTISNGIIYLTKEGEIEYQINQNNGLSNNTALYIFEDSDENIWVGLDNGINCINSQSSFKIFNDDKGFIGTVYTSIVFNDFLYLGTNQGLFYKKYNSKDSFKIIKNTEGQVLNLITYNNQLFCTHHLGLFIVNNNSAERLSNTAGVWNFKTIPNENDLLLVGSYEGLSILKKENGQWKIRNKIKGFDKSTRFFEFINDHEIWMAHGLKGVFKLKFNDDFTAVVNSSKDATLAIDKNSSLVKFKNRILLSNTKGIFAYNTKTKKFEKDLALSSVYTSTNYLSGKLVIDDTEKLWSFSKDNISYTTINNLSKKFKINTISIPFELRKGVVGFENIMHIKNNSYLLGTSNGYMIIDISNENKKNDYSIILNKITFKTLEDKYLLIDTHTKGKFNYGKNSLIFNYSIPEYDKFQIAQYQYKLEGNYNKWSNWSTKTEISFDNLTFGRYNLQIRGKIGDKLTNTIHYNFKVDRPLYLSNTAILFYILCLLGIIIITNRAFKRYYRKQHKQKELETEQLITKIKNEQLNQDIENKNRELAISTMNIIKKNEVLNNLKNELQTSSETKNLKALKLIDLHINNKADWDFFEKAINNVDRDFSEKIKIMHPNLSQNDLLFCSFLRLNLSSKEIAPILNISIKSVETRRFRLRKKLNLDHEDSLVSYLFKI